MHIYIHICMYIWFSIYVCIGVIASSLHQKHAIWQQATRQSSSLLIYSNKICFNETFYGCPAWSNTLLNIISYWFYPSISHWLYIRLYIYIIIYHYIPVYPTDIPLISQTSMLERARVHKGINCGAAFFCVRAQLVSWDSNLETKRTDSLKGFKRISQWFINKIQENIVTWLYKLKLYMSRCIDRFVSYFYIPHQFWHCNL